MKTKYLCILPLPLLTFISCGKASNEVKSLPLHEYIIPKELQDSVSRKRVTISGITRSQIRNASSDILSREHATQISGGFGEVRNYYREDNNGNDASLHMGVDTFLYSGTTIISPVDGEIIGSYWVRDNNSNYASGIGGVVLIKTKIEELNIDSSLKEMLYINFGTDDKPKISKVPKMQYVFNQKLYLPSSSKIKTKEEYENYWLSLLNAPGANKDKILFEKTKDDYITLTFMHLSKDTPSLFGKVNSLTYNNYEISYAPLDVKNPFKIKRGQTIGYVGTSLDNGGWQPHVHTEAFLYGYASRFQTREENYKIVSQSLTSSGPWGILKPVGTYNLSSEDLVNKATNTPWELTINSSSRMVDPNNIYKLYDSSDEVISYW